MQLKLILKKKKRIYKEEKMLKKTGVVLLFSTFLLLCASAQTRGLGGLKKKTVAQTMEAPRIELEQSQVCNVYSIAFSPDGAHIAAGYNNNIIRIWNIKTGSMEKILTGHTGAVWSVAYSPDGKILVSGSSDSTIICWDTGTGKIIRTLTGHTGTVSYVAYSTHGSYIASGAKDKTIKFWDATTGDFLQTLTGHTDRIAAISYSSSERFVASASWDKTARVYYSVGGRELVKLLGHTGPVYAVEFSPDEKQLATGSADKTIKLWNRETGKIINTISGYTGEVWAVAYSPDGKQIAGAASDGTLKVWDVSAGTECARFEGHDREIRSVCYSKDGNYLYSGDSGGIIKTWNAHTGELVATLLQCNDGEWVAWTPDGFLNGSDGALKELSYTVSGKKYSLEEIKQTVKRPDVVTAAMSGTKRPDDIKDSLATIVAADMIPEVNFKVLNADGSSRNDDKGRDITADIQIRDTGSGIGRVFAKMNGRLIEVSEGSASTNGDVISFSPKTPLSLRYGTNTFSVVAYNAANTNESTSAEVQLSWKGNVQKARLFILAAGVDSYPDKLIPQLKNCVADAASIIDTSVQYAGDLYSNVFVKLLTNSDVTQKNLITQIEEFGKQVKPDDVFILYLSGHGITHTDKNYYYIPYDAKYRSDEDIPKYGVSKWTIIKSLSSIMAENVTVVLDTCNSASFATERPDPKEFASMNKDALIERFGALGGYDLIAACSTYQVAVDNYNGHGVFTYCLLDAIKGHADLNKDGQVTSSELAAYITDEVPVQSFKKFGYKQEPQRSQPKFNYPMFGRLNPKEGQSLKDAAAIAKVASDLNISLEEASARLHNSAVPSSVTENSTATVNVSVEAEQRIADGLASPQGLCVTSTTENSVSLSWNSVTDATEYTVYYTSESERMHAVVNMEKADETDQTACTVTGLKENTSYFFRVAPCKNTIVSANSSLVTATTEKKREIEKKDNALFSDDTKGVDHTFGLIIFPNLLVFSLLHTPDGTYPGWELYYDSPSLLFKKKIILGTQLEVYKTAGAFAMIYGGYYWEFTKTLWLDLTAGLGISGYGPYFQQTATLAVSPSPEACLKLFTAYGLKYIPGSFWADTWSFGLSIGLPKSGFQW
jgi:WD40 repeat protein/uncharacterized caspase-like protein